MSPRAGGEAAKFGARFEGRWTTRYLLEVLLGRVDAVTVEVVDTQGDLVEFIVRRGDDEEGHQAKRQWQARTNWSLKLLGDQGILDAVKAIVDAGRRFHFVSTLPAEPLATLADAARRAEDFPAFSALISGRRKLGDDFAELANRWGGPHEAWAVLHRLEVSKPDERHLHEANVAIGQSLFEGEPEPAVAVLGDIAEDNLGVPLTADRLWRELDQRGVRPNPFRDPATVAEMVLAQTERFLADAKSRLLQPPINRAQTTEIADALARGDVLVVTSGDAGAGKSAVVAAAVDAAVEAGTAVLAFRLDRFMEIRSSRQLGQALELPASPAVALARAAAGRPALLVVDQLDAVSFASGRSPEVFGVVEELLVEATRFGNVQVLLACRRYDINNDPRLKALVDPERPQAPAVVEVTPLDPEDVKTAVAEIGLDPARLGARQIELLRLPLNLVLLRSVASEADALSFGTTRDLLGLFWKVKRRSVLARRTDVRFDRVIEVLVDAMSSLQRLAAPQEILEAESLDDDVEVLASEHLVIRDGRRISFFHETLFDYAFARRWIARNETLLDFLLSGEQALFRRAQVRQVLLHLREVDPPRFVREVRELLFDDRVRFHVKESVLALMRSLPDPTDAELGLMLELLAPESPWRERSQFLLRTTPWFDRLDDAGLIGEWLSSGESDLEERAVTILGSAGESRAGRAAELLAPHRSHAHFVDWLIWVTRFVGVENDRGLFELLLDATRTGSFDGHEHALFLSAHAVGDKAPEWGVELLAAWFDERPTALSLASGRVEALTSSEYGLNELIAKSAEGAAEAFVVRLLPYMQRVMAVAEHGNHLPRDDWHFSGQLWGSHLSQADDHLMHSMIVALRALAAANPRQLRKLVEPLVDDIHAAAQDLLYEALAASGAVHAEWAGQLVLRGGDALHAGYSGSDYWRTRELLRATAPHMSDETFVRVEALVAEYVPDWERTHPPSRGHASFVLLSALPEERLSESARRRLGELRRKFGRDEPEPPRGIEGGFVGPPIAEERAEHMTDEQWVGAMRKHASDEGDWQTFELRGGAYQLGHVLKAATMKEPERFARLALTLDASFNRHYLQGILLGLGDTTEDVDPDLVFEVMRHAAAAGDQDRWLGWPLKRLYEAEIPRDIVEIVLARALGRRYMDDETPTPGAAEEPHDMSDAFTTGLNTDRGGNATVLARLIAFDTDGARAAVVTPHLLELASDPSPAFRACVAEVVHTIVRWDRDVAIAAFETLARDRNPNLVKTNAFEALAIAMVVNATDVTLPIADELIGSDDPDVRERGARLVAFAATDRDRLELLERVAASDDPVLRRGAAYVLAARARWVSEPAVAQVLARLFEDDDDSVREAAATVAPNLRGESLDAHRELLTAFIASRASKDPTQFLLTLEHAPAPDHDLTLQVAHRIVDMHGGELGDIRTGAAGDARYLTELLLRSYSLVDDPHLRAEFLDVIDRLLEVGAYGIADAIDEARQ